ncbi:MAG: ABC-F family ATP-binding cassette domain-containing protein [Bryobacteraceae bacterium]
MSRSYGAKPIFQDLDISVSEGDRLGLIGPNGSGKSTLLKIMAGLEEPDSGERALRKLTRLGYVAQESTFADGLTVRHVLESAAPKDDELEARLNTTLGAAGLTPYLDTEAVRLSGGWRKRLAIAEALIRNPDILLLDEPTNQLDVTAILWLERLIAGAAYAVVVVSHDRYFLENAVTSMAELNPMYPEGLFRAEGSYSAFLEKRAAFLDSQQKLQDSLATKVRREVEWLRRGAKARTTKSKARIDEANRLIGQLDDVSSRNRTSVARIDFTASERKTKRLIETENVSCVLGGRTLFQGLDLSLRPGSRLGLAGPNGGGKTTLLRLLRGEIEPSAGTIRRADHLKIVYFDQSREQLDPAVPLKRALAEAGDTVIYRGRPQHVAGWAKRFLFRAEQLEVAVGKLSGGERARVLIARLMLEPADVLLLDEPTNDLDIPTLEVLEESLVDFPGAMVLVTHDRYLMDTVATSVLGIDGKGGIQEFADYAQWEQAQSEQSSAKPEAKSEKDPPTKPQPSAGARRKLSYLEQREFEGMEPRILEAESILNSARSEMEHPDTVSDPIHLQQAYAAMQQAQAEVDRLYERWSELEGKLAN